MNTRKIIILFTILMLAVGLMPLTAQNSPAGALVANHVFNRDMDIYMMPNFAPFVNYQRFFSFVQGSVSGAGFGFPLPRSGGPGLSAGYATNIRGTFLHFFLNTEGFSLDNTTTQRDTTEEWNRDARFNFQFDTLIGTPDLGAFKLGLLFNDVGHISSETPNFGEAINTGFFTTSLSYGRNFINDDFSMILAGGSVRLRLPMYERNTRVTAADGTTTRTTTRLPQETPGVPMVQFPGWYPTSSIRLEVEPHLYWFFRPRLEPMVVISHIFLQNTVILQFFPEETSRTQVTDLSTGWTRQDRRYIGNTLFGYFNRLYVITPRFSLAWRLNFTLGFFYNYEGHIRTRAPGSEDITTRRVTNEAWYFAAVVVPRVAFSYQIIPATLTLTGGLILNQLGPVNAIGWQHYRVITTDDDYNTVTTRVENIFNPIRPYITMGAAWYLNPHMVLESGITIDTLGSTNNPVRGPGRHLNEITVAVVYRR